MLERLRKAGLKMAVATSSRRAIAEEYLINANVYKFFDVLVCGDEIKQGKLIQKFLPAQPKKSI